MIQVKSSAAGRRPAKLLVKYTKQIHGISLYNTRIFAPPLVSVRRADSRAEGSFEEPTSYSPPRVLCSD